MPVDPLFRSLSKLAKEHGGVIDPDEMAQHFLRTLLSASMEGYNPIQSIVISFGGIAGALAFSKTAKQLLKASIGRMGVETVTIRADGISIEIKGNPNIQQALDAFYAVSNEVNKRKTSVDVTTKAAKRAISTKQKNATKSADGDDAPTAAAVTPKATKVANRRQRQSRKRR
jgi:hypothetical protein